MRLKGSAQIDAFQDETRGIFRFDYGSCSCLSCPRRCLAYILQRYEPESEGLTSKRRAGKISDNTESQAFFRLEGPKNEDVRNAFGAFSLRTDFRDPDMTCCPLTWFFAISILTRRVQQISLCCVLLV